MLCPDLLDFVLTHTLLAHGWHELGACACVCTTWRECAAVVLPRHLVLDERAADTCACTLRAPHRPHERAHRASERTRDFR
jgi:hypothetical protein